VINDVVRDSPADIDHHGTGLFLGITENDLRGGDRIHHDIVHFDIELLYAANRVLNPGHHPMNDVVIGLQLGAEHPERINHALLSIDIIALDDRVQDYILLRNRDLLGLVFDIPDFFFRDFAFIRQGDRASVVETLQVTTGHCEPHAFDFLITAILGIGQSIVHAL